MINKPCEIHVTVWYMEINHTMCVFACVRVCLRACVRACVRAFVRSYRRSCVHGLVACSLHIPQ